AIGGILDGSVRRQLSAPIVQKSRLRNRVEVGCGSVEAGKIAPQRNFSAQDRALENILVVDDGMHDRQLALNVGLGQAVKVHRAGLEIAAIAAPGEVKLRKCIVRCQSQQIARLQALLQRIVIKVAPVRKQGAVPAPDPSLREIELARRFKTAAK